ncbi:MAG: ORF6C domain-containing protein [Desulfurobacteriaceae bacterium]
MEERKDLKEKLQELERLLSDREVESFISNLNVKISGKDNLVSVFGTVRKEINNHFHAPKFKVTIEPELSPKELKEIKDFVSRIVALELQARVYRIASPQGITARTKKSTFAQVWKRIHDKFEITDYKMLRRTQYQEAIFFLRNWESKLLNELVKRGVYKVDIPKNYLLRKLFGVAKANGKTKEDLELYCIQKFSLTLREALPGHIWYVYTRYATRKRKSK